jgi:hypothetical protein
MILSMKNFIKLSLIFSVAAASGFFFTACQDGEPGPSGTQGEKGVKGDAGDTGANGVGYDDFPSYGNIVMRYQGTRIDGVAFDKTIDFKFAPSGIDASQYSGVFDWTEGSPGRTFQIDRYSLPAIVHGYTASNAVGVWYSRPDDEEEEAYLSVYSYTSIYSDDMKFFRLGLYLEYPPSETVTEYSFNSATGELAFKFHAVVPADQNETDHDLDLTADVNVKVMKAVEPIDSPD